MKFWYGLNLSFSNFTPLSLSCHRSILGSESSMHTFSYRGVDLYRYLWGCPGNTKRKTTVVLKYIFHFRVLISTTLNVSYVVQEPCGKAKIQCIAFSCGDDKNCLKFGKSNHFQKVVALLPYLGLFV